jgi:iron complex transport system ATP-binding protein
MSVLNGQHLTLSYEQNTIIENLSLNIPEGKVTVLVGPNGCGKSTLLRGLSRLLKPRAGQVVLDSHDIWKMPTKDLAKQLGILPQGPVAPEGLTVHELVAQGRYPHQSWFQQWSVEDERMTQEALFITGLTDLADRPIDTLSGGQRQRAWIAMTLAQDSDIILLDEPTTFLDLAYQMEVLDLLHDLNVERGKTIVMVLHDLNQACRYGDYLVAVHEGRIAAHGHPQDVIQAEMIRDVFGIECHIMPDPITGTPLVVPMGRRKPSAPLKPLIAQAERVADLV